MTTRARTRKTVTGRKVKETSLRQCLTLHTNCPTKWVAVDMEWGNLWVGRCDNAEGHEWDPVSKDDLLDVQTVLQKRLEEIYVETRKRR